MQHIADAEQAKETGGMIALFPCDEDAEHYAVPGGEAVDELHVTLAYFGSDVGDADPSEILGMLDRISECYGQIHARAFAWGLFNPTGYADREPCAVYLIGDSEDISPLREEVLDAVSGIFDLPAQHEPFHAHMTGGYSLPLTALQAPGDVLFDRIELRWAGRKYVFPLH
ncbi:putative 2'-5' RNA ligase LigT [Rhodococcus phage E3]|uniref:RNA ligase n=1 Tax=Rhodococcus phage E3 TaxID=1007869 RepID=UPI0002C6E34F|nr:RNA ligase [Rhodococcus phage E3]AEQ20987.1 putative 2'-5' RNA ligase LigT [Rhodococcus phage E3]